VSGRRGLWDEIRFNREARLFRLNGGGYFAPRLDWKGIRDATLLRYFRRFQKSRFSISDWNALVARYVDGQSFGGAGSNLVYKERQWDCCRPNKYHDDEIRITQRRLVDISSGCWIKSPVIGRTYKYGDLRNRLKSLERCRDKRLEKEYEKNKDRIARESLQIIDRASRSEESIAQLYRHWDKDGRLLYAGIACNHVNRLSQHRGDSAWFPLIAKITIEHFESREAALIAERRAIRSEHPIFNRQHSLLRLVA